MNITQEDSLQRGLLCCRVCLMLDCRLYNIHEYKLADTFTRISGTSVTRDRLPQYLCAYCLVLLLKCASFRDMCLRTLKRLTPARFKRALDTDYIRKYHLPHRWLNLTQTEIEAIELLPSEDLHNDQGDDIASVDGINEAYPEILELIKISDDVSEDEIVFNSLINKRNIEKTKTIENIMETEKTTNKQIETSVKDNMVLKIGRVFNESIDIDSNLMKMGKENTDSTETSVEENMVLIIDSGFNESMDFDNNLIKIGKENTDSIEAPMEENVALKTERDYIKSMDFDNNLMKIGKENTDSIKALKNMVLKIGHDYNKSMDIDNNLMKMRKENTETMKMMMIEVKNDKIEFKVGGKSDDTDDIYYEGMNEKIRDVKHDRRKVQNVKRSEHPKIIQNGNIRRRQPKFNIATFESTYNFKIHTLTKEEQLKEMQARKLSQNYLTSQFKCEACWKGFGLESAYNNHRAIHSPSHGPYFCEICSTYFVMLDGLHQHQNRHRLKFHCNECNFITKNRELASRHHDAHTGKTYECQHCSKSFMKRKSYFSHLRLAHPEVGVDCVDCGETFLNDYGLKQHRKQIHNVKSKKFICFICSAKFYSVEALNRHTDTAGEHGALRPCEQCGENCASEQALQEHVGVAHPTESHLCEVCSVAFSNAAALATHNRRKHLGQHRTNHNKVDPCMCEECGAIIRNPSSLAVHKRTHLAVKPFACPQCPKTFAAALLLRNHMRMHNGEKPYKCPECPLAFNQVPNCKRHYKVAHLGIRGSFPCPICGRTSTTKSSLKVHVRAVHGDAGWPRRNRSKRKKKTAQ